MKNRILFVFLVVCIISIALILIVVLTGNRSDEYIPETPQFKLPDGAKARIGKGRIIDVAYVQDGTQFAVSSDTGIWFYDANSLEEQELLSVGKRKVITMSFSPDGKTLATAGGGKTVHLWDTDTLEHSATFIRDVYLRPAFVFDFVSFLGDSNMLATRYIGRFDLWDASTNTHHLELKNIYTYGNIVFSQDGRLVANVWSSGVKIWDTVADKELKYLTQQKDSVESISFSPDGNIIAGGTREKHIILWDVETGEVKRILKGHNKKVGCLDFSPDGKTLVSGSDDHTVRLWNVATGRRKKTLKKHSSGIRKVLFSPDGKTFLSYSWDNIVNIWDASTGKLKNTLMDHHNVVTSISLSPDGRTLATGNYDKTVRLWDASTGKHIMRLKGHKDVVSSVSFSPDRLSLASGSHDKSIRLWDATTGTHIKTLKGHFNGVKNIKYSPDGNHFASQTDISFWVWDVATGKRKLSVPGFQTNYINRSIDFSPDGRFLAVRGKDSTIHLWDFDKGKHKRTIKWNAMSMTFSPDGKHLASSSHGLDKIIRFWNVENGEVVQNIVVDCPQEGYIHGFVTSLTFTLDGKYILLGCQDGTIRVLDPTTGEKVKSIKAHVSQVSDMSFSSDGTTLISMSTYASVLIWDFASIMEDVRDYN